MSPLAAIIVGLLITHQGPHITVHAPHVRNYPGGAAAFGEMRATQILEASATSGAAPWEIAALEKMESEFKSAATSFRRGRGRGLMQLNPRGSYHADWRRRCRLVPASCDTANVVVGAAVLFHGIRLCGNFERAVYWYRRGICGTNSKAKYVAALADRIHSALETL